MRACWPGACAMRTTCASIRATRVASLHVISNKSSSEISVVALKHNLLAVPAEFFQLIAGGGDHVVESANICVNVKAVRRRLPGIFAKAALGMLRRLRLDGSKFEDSAGALG